MHCKDYGEEMALGSLVGQMRTLDGQIGIKETEFGSLAPGDDKPWTYRIAFPTAVGRWRCLVEVYPEQATTRTAMLVHFLHLHVWDTVVILDKGNLPHPR